MRGVKTLLMYRLEWYFWLLNRVAATTLFLLVWIHLLEKVGVLSFAQPWLRYLFAQALLLAVLVHGSLGIRQIILENLKTTLANRLALDILFLLFLLFFFALVTRGLVSMF